MLFITKFFAMYPKLISDDDGEDTDVLSMIEHN